MQRNSHLHNDTHRVTEFMVTQADTVILTHAGVPMYKENSTVNHTPPPSLPCSQTPTFTRTPSPTSAKSLTVTPTQTCLVADTLHGCTHNFTQSHIYTATHTAPNTSRAHFISNCEQMLLVFINLQTLCCQSLWLPLSLFPTLSLSARRQVSASIFSSSVAVKLNGIGLIAENQREG